MNRTPYKLHQATTTCRDMAAECVTEEAREALLEVADSLDGEATANEQQRKQDVPIFDWTR